MNVISPVYACLQLRRCRDPIWSVAWSYRSEYELVSGDARGQVRDRTMFPHT